VKASIHTIFSGLALGTALCALLVAAATWSERRSVLDPMFCLPGTLAVCCVLVGMGLYSRRKWARLVMSAILGIQILAILVTVIVLIVRDRPPISTMAGAAGVFALPIMALAALASVLNSRLVAREERGGLGGRPLDGSANQSRQPTAARVQRMLKSKHLLLAFGLLTVALLMSEGHRLLMRRSADIPKNAASDALMIIRARYTLRLYTVLATNAPPKTLQSARTGVRMLKMCLDTNNTSGITRPDLMRELAMRRDRAVSNVVAGLQQFSGERFGPDVEAWREWLKTQGADGGGEFGRGPQAQE
jgi:hypothetical protein